MLSSTPSCEPCCTLSGPLRTPVSLSHRVVSPLQQKVPFMLAVFICSPTSSLKPFSWTYHCIYRAIWLVLWISRSMPGCFADQVCFAFASLDSLPHAPFVSPAVENMACCCLCNVEGLEGQVCLTERPACVFCSSEGLSFASRQHLVGRPVDPRGRQSQLRIDPGLP